MKKYRMSLISILLFIVVLAFSYIWHLFSKHDIPFQTLSALLGAAITVIITNLLLNNQTESEFANQKKSKVYEEKLHIYQDYLKLLCNIVKDRIITTEDYANLQYQSSLVALHTSQKHYQEIMEQTKVILTKGCPTEDSDDASITQNLMSIVYCFQQELYEKGNKRQKVGQHESIQELTEIVSSAKCYKASGSIGAQPTEYIAGTKKGWKDYLNKWEEMGWRKDEDNGGQDYLRFNMTREGFVCDSNNRNRANVYVDILFEMMYGHYIIRAKSNPRASILFQNLYGGFRAGDTWWKVLESPIYELEKLTFLTTFDTNQELKDIVACWFDYLIESISVYYSENNKS